MACIGIDLQALGVEMAWAVPEHSTEEIDSAGRILAAANDPDGFDRVLAVIDNFRASHHMPLNTFQTTLRAKAERFHGLVTQRVKRLRAIQYKLQKHTKRPIPLSQRHRRDDVAYLYYRSLRRSKLPQI